MAMLSHFALHLASRHWSNTIAIAIATEESIGNVISSLPLLCESTTDTRTHRRVEVRILDLYIHTQSANLQTLDSCVYSHLSCIVLHCIVQDCMALVYSSSTQSNAKAKQQGRRVSQSVCWPLRYYVNWEVLDLIPLGITKMTSFPRHVSKVKSSGFLFLNKEIREMIRGSWLLAFITILLRFNKE